MNNPTNQDILDSFKHHTDEDLKFQGEPNEIHKAMMARMDTLVTKDDVREVFAEELKNFFRIGGMRSKTVIITTATLIGALVVIFGGLKSLLAWLGFHFTGQ